jgi:membrane-associated phospholipid phosphatase
MVVARKMKTLLVFILVVSCIQSAEAQQNLDSLSHSVFKNDTLTNQKKVIPSTAPHFKEWIIPTTMVIYGAMTIHIDAFTDLNEDAKDEIWNKYPHHTVTVDNYLQFVPAIAVYGLNFVGIQGEHNFLDRTMIYALSNVIMGVTVFSLKNITHEQRPNGSDYQSFPSGHTAEAFASAEFLMQEYKNVSVWYGIGGYVVAASVAYLRMYNNEHWLNDVVAGAGFGILSTRLAYILYPKIKKIFSHTPIPNSVLMPCYQNSSFGIAFVHEFK